MGGDGSKGSNLDATVIVDEYKTFVADDGEWRRRVVIFVQCVQYVCVVHYIVYEFLSKTKGI